MTLWDDTPPPAHPTTVRMRAGDDGTGEFVLHAKALEAMSLETGGARPS
jgi:hypothetical protein